MSSNYFRRFGFDIDPVMEEDSSQVSDFICWTKQSDYLRAFILNTANSCTFIFDRYTRHSTVVRCDVSGIFCQSGASLTDDGNMKFGKKV